MSRVGKKIIQIPSGVQVEVVSGGAFGHQQVKVTGSKGSLTQDIRKPIKVVLHDQTIEVVNQAEGVKSARALHGLYRALIQNQIDGVHQGFERALEIVGTGYRAEQQGESIVLSIGYSHKITFTPPSGVQVVASDQTQIKVNGIDRQLVGQTAAKIRGLRPPEPYKGKGIRYKGEHILRKSVKTA